VDGGVPNLLLTLPRRDTESVGRMIYFFEFSCGQNIRSLRQIAASDYTGQ
jgi:glucose-6-phosphate isomerase